MAKKTGTREVRIFQQGPNSGGSEALRGRVDGLANGTAVWAEPGHREPDLPLCAGACFRGP